MVPSQAIIRTDLAAPMVEFNLAANRLKFIAPRVLPPRIMGVQAADVGKVPLEALLQSRDTKRAPGGGYKRNDFEFDKFSYSTSERAIEETLDDRTTRIYADLLDAEQIKTKRAIDTVLRSYEMDVSAAIFNTTTFSGNKTGAATAVWTNHSSAKPIDDVHTGAEAVLSNSGLDANALIVSAFGFWHLQNCDQIVDRVKWSKTATQEEIAGLIAPVLGIPKILVAGGLKNTANAQQPAVIDRIWSKTMAMVACVAETNDPQEACLGRTFMWGGDGATGGAPGASETEIAVLVEEYREESRRGSVIRVRTEDDIVLMYPEAGYLLTAIAA